MPTAIQLLAADHATYGDAAFILAALLGFAAVIWAISKGL